MRSPVCLLALALFVVACGDEDPLPSSEAAPDAAVDSSGASSQDVGARDSDDTSDMGVVLPSSTWPGACERRELPVNGDEPLYVISYDYADAPATVWIRSVDRTGQTAVFRLRDIDTEPSCLRPPEEIGELRVDLVGCPAALDTDLDGDGQQSGLDRDYAYQYGPGGALVASDSYDALNDTFLDARWTWRFSAQGGLLGAERDLSAGERGRINVEAIDDGFAFDIDRDGDGGVDERRTWRIDDNGRVVSGTRSTADPATGELVQRARTEWRYDCPDADGAVP